MLPGPVTTQQPVQVPNDLVKQGLLASKHGRFLTRRQVEGPLHYFSEPDIQMEKIVE